MNPTGLLIILTKNEEPIIEEVIDNVRSSLNKVKDVSIEIFLWDSSSDNTAELARAKSVRVFKDQGPSLGWSYYRAMKHFTKHHKSDFIITMDGDGQVNSNEIPLFFETYRRGSDMVVGSRFKSPGAITYTYPRINYLAIQILSTVISVAAFKKFTDSHGGLRVMSFPVAANFSFIGTHSYVQETVIDAVKRGYKVVEVDSAWNPRLWGDSRVSRSPLKYACRMALPLIVRMRLHRVLLALGGGLALIFQSGTLLGACFFIWATLETYGFLKMANNKKQIGVPLEF